MLNSVVGVKQSPAIAGSLFSSISREAARFLLRWPDSSKPAEFQAMCEITARECMTTRLITLDPEMDVLKAIDLLLKNRISGAPVVDPFGNFLGVFSEKCCMQVLLDAAYDQLPSNNVRMFMDTEAKTIHADTHLLSIAQVFLLTNYRRLPVLEDGVLIGQVSRRDVMRSAQKLLSNQGTPRETTPSFLYLSRRGRSQRCSARIDSTLRSQERIRSKLRTAPLALACSACPPSLDEC